MTDILKGRVENGKLPRQHHYITQAWPATNLAELCRGSPLCNVSQKPPGDCPNARISAKQSIAQLWLGICCSRCKVPVGDTALMHLFRTMYKWDFAAAG